VKFTIQSWSYVDGLDFHKLSIVLPKNFYRASDCYYEKYGPFDEKHQSLSFTFDTNELFDVGFFDAIKKLSPIPDFLVNENWVINDRRSSPLYSTVKQRPFFEFFLIIRKLNAHSDSIAIVTREVLASFLTSDFLAFDSLAREILTEKNYEFYQEFTKLFLLASHKGLLLFQK
jgi:hypothetical protein